MSIYTRAGDSGMTSLFSGKKLPKSDVLVDLYGSIDELNSNIGVIVSSLKQQNVQEFLRKIQSDLFDIGSVLSGNVHDLSALSKRVSEMEAQIDVMDESLPKLRTFILPGGSPPGSLTHEARSFCRSVERKAVAYMHILHSDSLLLEETMGQIIQYLNRLSDFLFVLARFVNAEEHAPEIEWKGLKEESI